MTIVEDLNAFYLKKERYPLQEETYKIIGLAMEVHKFFGPAELRDRNSI